MVASTTTTHTKILPEGKDLRVLYLVSIWWVSVCIILRQEYKSYRKALKLIELETLYERRKKSYRKFAKKAQKHIKFKTSFKPNIKKSRTRTIPTRFCEVAARTDRFRQSPISHLINILNIEWNNNNAYFHTVLLRLWSIEILDGRTYHCIMLVSFCHLVYLITWQINQLQTSFLQSMERC